MGKLTISMASMAIVQFAKCNKLPEGTWYTPSPNLSGIFVGYTVDEYTTIILWLQLPESKPSFSYGFPMVFPLRPPFEPNKIQIGQTLRLRILAHQEDQDIGPRWNCVGEKWAQLNIFYMGIK